MVETGNRRLIRPPLNELKEKINKNRTQSQNQKKIVPTDQTHAESFYYIKQMQSKTPMVVVFKDGEIIHGVIEWYDKTCLKVNRTDGPNLLVYKTNVKYMYKE